MIEFKAECGHTVRARDDNAGGVVRCSYCGKEAAVPENREDDLDFLFRDIEQGEESKGKRKKRKKTRAVFKSGKNNKPFDPFAVILKLCYAAALIVVVIVVGRKFVLPLIRGETVKPPAVAAGNGDAQSANADSDKKPGRRRRGGTTTVSGSTKGYANKGRKGLRGLFVDSTPPGASGYFVKQDEAPREGRINRMVGAVSFRIGDTEKCSRASNGRYMVEVAIPWNDNGLVRYKGYRQFRRDIERANENERRKLVNRYFLPDESESVADVFIDESPDQIYIVHQYRDVEVHNDRSPKGVRALFLPRILDEDKRLNMEELVLNYLPTDERYNFDEEHVKNELDYYDVSGADQPFVIKALKRVGKIPYITPDGKTRLFMINIHDGRFSQKVIRQR
ncbi:MAG: hypothetical protein ACYTHJ_11845 [Planctomycetota bacterium]|jgi:hypothetical protein